MSNDYNPQNEFTKVTYKNKRKRRPKNRKEFNTALTNLPEQNSFNQELYIKRINEAKSELLTTDLYQSVVALLKEGLKSINNPQINRIICFGLGRISELTVPRLQLSLLLCLKNLFNIEVEVADPIFNENDISLLKHLGIKVEINNLEGKFENNQNITLFYLPHCPKQLMNNLLWSNWCLNLSKCIIIGNSISRVIEDNSKKDLATNAQYISKISPYVLELGIANSFKIFEVFNDTSIHFFPLERLKLLSDDFWEFSEEPRYEENDIEFIRNKFESKVFL